MFVPSTDTIILAIIGSVGIIASLTVLMYGFVRNRTARGDWQ